MEGYEGGDHLTDFEVGVDHIIVSRFLFGFGDIGGPAAALTSAHAGWVSGSGTPGTAHPTFIYDPGTGVLMFDGDGNGSLAAVNIATFTPGTNLTLNDIWSA